ncbi:MAG: hypothetical protein JSW39_12550 [Desulfobacterales bacterium]|nr:MAG: hypothetical protein JSW39_12550 [Desulfobacterales bacterium]
MNFDRDGKTGGREHVPDTPWRMHGLIVIVGIIMTGIVGFGFHKGIRMNAVHAPLVDAAMKIKLEATTAHLWFEEILSGDRHEAMDAVWKHLDEADWYAEAMLAGGQNREGTFIPLDDKEMRRTIGKVQEKLAQFRAITRQRLAAQESSGAGTDIDQRYDDVFAHFVNQAGDVETRLQQVIAQDLRSFRSTQVGLIIACVFLFSAIGVAFHRFDRRRAQDFLSLREAKETLEDQIAERQRVEEMLRSERDKFQGILNAIGEGMYIINQDYIIEYQNEIFEKLFGDSVGRKCCATYMHSPAICNFCHAHETLISGHIKQVEVTLPNGRNYDMIFSPFSDMDGEIKAIVLLRDITATKTIQAEAMRIGHLASLGELAAGVAHEINNPINGIINYAEILKDQCHERGEDDEIPRRIIKEGDRIAQIVQNLLSFARNRKEAHSCVHVKDILSDTLSLVNQQIGKDGIKLSVDMPDGLPRIKAHSQEIQQVFLNILSNARYALNQKFPTSSEDKIIAIQGQRIENEGRRYVRTTFYDSGSGIPRNILDKISNPFFSTKPRGDGTGLGLSISHGIIKSHGGRLLFESAEGVYTKAMVDLPVDDERKLSDHTIKE